MFAVYLLSGKMQYPTTVFLAKPDAAPAAIPGYLQAKDIELPMKYFGDKFNEKLSYDKFSAEFKPEWE
jgi:thioredoxin-related protein